MCGTKKAVRANGLLVGHFMTVRWVTESDKENDTGLSTINDARHSGLL